MSEKPVNAKELSIKHKKFVEAILAGMNHTDAYLAAGYKNQDRLKLGKAAYNLWKKVEVQEEIKSRKAILWDQYKEQMDAQVADAIEARGRIINYPHMGSSVQMRAIADTLDRAGLKLPDEHRVVNKQEHEVTVKLDAMSDDSRTEHLELLNRFASVYNGGKESVAEPASESE